MRVQLFILGLFAFVFGSGAIALVTDLSNKRIEIRYSFDGADLILFGPLDHLRLTPPAMSSMW